MCVVWSTTSSTGTESTQTTPIRGAGDAEQEREKLAAVYRKRGYTPERAAHSILRAVDRNRAVAPIAAEAHLHVSAVTRRPAAGPLGRS